MFCIRDKLRDAVRLLLVLQAVSQGHRCTGIGRICRPGFTKSPCGLVTRELRPRSIFSARGTFSRLVSGEGWGCSFHDSVFSIALAGVKVTWGVETHSSHAHVYSHTYSYVYIYTHSHLHIHTHTLIHIHIYPY